ncbi:MAG: hypothetical protein NVSMB47_00460 [Polyangiales bacterium]
MDSSNVSEWLHLLLRWMHVIAGIMWIGSSIFFNWLDSHLEKPAIIGAGPDGVDGPRAKKAGVEGVLWMVHSGGFYEVEKKLVAPEELPPVLHWFKWEAAFTWISGISLLVLLYYLDGGILLVDPNVSAISVRAAIGIGLTTLLVSWAIYDTVWSSPLGKGRGEGAIAITVAMILGVAILLSRLLSGRAAYMHVGAMIGTWMVANVWMRIIPAQRAMVDAVKAGKAPDPERGRKAKQRSKHNNYFTYPVLFVMVSNHFPNTYGVKLGWLILAGFFVLGAGIRHFQNVGDRSPKLLLGVMAGMFGLTALLSMRKSSTADLETQPYPGPDYHQGTAGVVVPPANSAGGPQVVSAKVDPATAGSITGVVTLSGTPPPRKPLTIPGSCARKEPAFEDSVVARDGKLANVFVRIAEGLETWSDPPPETPVVIDQRGCTYAPRVLGVQVGQPLTFVNDDPVMHNVHALGDDNGFNAGMPGKDQRITRKFDAAEVMVHVKCDVHPWMTAYIGVVPHPYFATTGESGAYSLGSVPPGEYVLEAWHEVYGKKTAKVTVPAKGAVAADFAFGN